MKLPYRCLIMDHDDTTVLSTPLVHYPAHVETMRKIRPGRSPVSLEEWFRRNFDPGIMEYLRKGLGFSEEEIEEEYRVWRDFTTSRVPDFVPGMLELLASFREAGGIVTVVSHSEADIIERDYRAASTRAEREPFVPDRIHGWTREEAKRKPHPYPVLAILEEFRLDPREALVVDDLRPGVEMAKGAGVDCAAAGWGHDIGEIRSYMREHCSRYFSTVEEFRAFVLP